MNLQPIVTIKKHDSTPVTINTNELYSLKPTTPSKEATITLTSNQLLEIFALNKIPVARKTIEVIQSKPTYTVKVQPIGYRNGEWIYANDGNCINQI